MLSKYFLLTWLAISVSALAFSDDALSALVSRRLILDQRESYELTCKVSQTGVADKNCLVEYKINGSVVHAASIPRSRAETITKDAIVDPKKIKSGDSDSDPVFSWEIRKGSHVTKSAVSDLSSNNLGESMEPGLRMEIDFITALDEN